ncbi:hypothetical protein FCV25MIE_27205 [Fagus crenata]
MRRFQVNRASIAKMSEKLCPKIQVKEDKAGVKASECLLMYSREGKYEGMKKSTVTMGAGTSKKGAITVGVGTSGQAATCGRLASADGAIGSASGVTSSVGATGTGTAAGGGASRKAKVVVVPIVEKAMTRTAAKKQKKP